MSLPPEYGLYRKIDTQTMKVETERALNKLRWNIIINEGNSKTEEKELVMTKDDGNTKIVDINNLKCSELPFNPNVSMPKALSFDKEIRYHQFKEEVKDIVGKYAKKTVDLSNLDENEREGLNSLKKKVADTSVICYKTDKSGRWSCDTEENYKYACNKHLNDPSKTETISLEEHERAEREMNSHGYALLRMMGLNNDRIRLTMQSSNNVLAPFYCFRKDHKEIEQGKEVEGPKTRPLCGATDCLTRRTSFLLSELLVEIIPTTSTQCDSTQELSEEIKLLNKNTVDKNWIVCSLDVDALYPSLEIDECAKVIEQQLLGAEFEVKGLKWTEITLYLRYHLSEGEIQELQLTEYCPTRVSKKGRQTSYIRSIRIRS